jgi:hypothetical protein
MPLRRTNSRKRSILERPKAKKWNGNLQKETIFKGSDRRRHDACQRLVLRSLKRICRWISATPPSTLRCGHVRETGQYANCQHQRHSSHTRPPSAVITSNPIAPVSHALHGPRMTGLGQNRRSRLPDPSCGLPSTAEMPAVGCHFGSGPRAAIGGRVSYLRVIRAR